MYFYEFISGLAELIVSYFLNKAMADGDKRIEMV
jgi:hypothetical protein